MSEREDYAEPEPASRLPIIWLFVVSAVLLVAALYWLVDRFIVVE
jgi:hypothetical protein